jgi:hypothetical protein
MFVFLFIVHLEDSLIGLSVRSEQQPKMTEAFGNNPSRSHDLIPTMEIMTPTGRQAHERWRYQADIRR